RSRRVVRHRRVDPGREALVARILDRTGGGIGRAGRLRRTARPVAALGAGVRLAGRDVLMDSWTLLLEGFATALQPQYLMWAFIGVFIGTAVGVLPGIGPAMTVALLLPLTYTLDATAAIITFAGIYYGGMYGGSTTSILRNTPGESASIVTAIEGNRMARAGRGAAALATAAIGSFVAGTLATVALTFLAPVVARWAVRLGEPDYFALMVVAFVTVGALLGSSVPRGLAALALGLFLGLVGTDTLTGQQ